MRIRNLSIMLALLMVLSVLPLGQIQVNLSPESETNPESTDADLQEETNSNLADGRQTAVESAQWEFDTTAFGMMAASTTNQGAEGIQYHPCITPWGWREDVSNNLFDSQVPHLRWFYGGGISGNAHDPPTRYMSEHLDCYSWDAGVADNGDTLWYNFQVSTGDGSTEYVPEHTSHDLGRLNHHDQWQITQSTYFDESTDHGQLDADNILDMAVDNSYNTYVVGSWDGNRMVFPNKVGTHIYLDNSGLNGNGPDMQEYWDDDTFDENHNKDIFVAKMDDTGTWLWANSIHHYGVETASSIAVSQSGEVYIGGTLDCEGEESPVIFPTTPRNEITGDITGITFPCDDYEPVGFVARLDTNGAFTHVEKVEYAESFSSVSDIAIDPKNDETLYFIGKMGYCESKNCPSSDSYMVGKLMTDYSLNPSPWNLEWVEFVDNFTMTEIEMAPGGAVITGFTDGGAATIGASSILPDKIVVANIASQTSSGSVVWNWATSCSPPSTNPDWTNPNNYKWQYSANPSWGLSVGSNIALFVEPGSECGALNNNFYGFQVVSLDIDGNWLWTNGDVKDTTNMPANYQFSSDAHGADLDHSTNGDVIISVNLGKIVMVNGKNYIPQNGLSDMLLLRLDDDTGINIWDHQEINSECDNPSYGFQLSASNTCPDYKRGAADARRMVVKGLDDIFMSGMVYGKEVYFHDGLPEHCDYDYAQPYWDDVNGNTVLVPPHLQGSRGGDMNYVTKCVDGAVWASESNGTLPQDYEMIFPQHGTQWHGGDPYFAHFDACPRVSSGSTVADPVGTGTSGSSASGRTDWYVSPVGEPSNIDNTRYDCDTNGTYNDPTPNVDIVGCMEPYAMNYNPDATIPCADCCEWDTSVPGPSGTTGNNGEPCNCVPKDSIKNMSISGDLSRLNIMEITAPGSSGSPQGANAGFYHMQYDVLIETGPNGILSEKLSDTSMEFATCDLRTSARECYDFYTSDNYGNYEEFGDYIAIRTYNEHLHAGNIDAVWLDMANGDTHYAVDIVYFDHGNAPPGTSYENEILGAPDNDPNVNPISSPIGYTHLGPQFTTIVLCFDSSASFDNGESRGDNDTTHLGDDPPVEEKEECETCEDNTIPSISLLATLGITMLAVFASRRREV